MNAIAWRFWNKAKPILYVQDVKGRKGDWGYTTDVNKALPLTPTQQIRFAADCRAVGETAKFIVRGDL
jgi:hypothetical protein